MLIDLTRVDSDICSAHRELGERRQRPTTRRLEKESFHVIIGNAPHIDNHIRPNVNPRMSYPSYAPMDRYIDLDRLISLDQYLTERIKKHAADSRDSLFLNQHRLDQASAYVPGVREIWLTRTRPGTPYDYLDPDRDSLWEYTEAADEFSELVSFIAALPFKSTGRMLLIYDDAGREVPAHQDHQLTDVCHDFIWFRTNLKKPFYLLDHVSGEKLYVDSYSMWFDTVNQYHGSDAAYGLSFSFRVDGHFTDEFRAQIPKPEYNAASTPALWASLARGTAQFGGSR